MNSSTRLTRFPLRILLATDAASEGIDLQRHCHRMIHVEIPFSPTRLEQRNGRIDRHGQPAAEVLIHHFVGAGWERAPAGSLEADLGFLSLVARKVETIRDDLGTVGPVLAEEVERKMLGLPANIDRRPADNRSRAARALNRLERNLREEIGSLRAQLDASVEDLGITPAAVERVVQTALELARQPALRAGHPRARWRVGCGVPGVRDATAHPKLGPGCRRRHRPAHGRAASGDVRPRESRRGPTTSCSPTSATGSSRSPCGSCEPRSGRPARMYASAGCAPGSASVDEPVVVAHARLVITGSDGHRLHEEVIQAGGRIAGAASPGTPSASCAMRAPRPRRRMPARRSRQSCQSCGTRSPARCYEAVEARGRERADSLQRVLADRATSDVDAIATVLTDLRGTIQAQLDELEVDQQLTLDFDLGRA